VGIVTTSQWACQLCTVARYTGLMILVDLSTGSRPWLYAFARIRGPRRWTQWRCVFTCFCFILSTAASARRLGVAVRRSRMRVPSSSMSASSNWRVCGKMMRCSRKKEKCGGCTEHFVGDAADDDRALAIHRRVDARELRHHVAAFYLYPVCSHNCRAP